MDPSRLAAIGYGAYRPLANNETAAGRNDNRRVAIVISRQGADNGIAKALKSGINNLEGDLTVQ